MICRYDLRHEQVSFDFYGWLAIAVGRGATEIVFGTEAIRPSEIWTTEQLRRKFESIIAPGPALVGLPSREGRDGERISFLPKNKFKLEHLVGFVRDGGVVRRIRSPLPAGTARYTVTLRQQSRKSRYRNSDEAVWREFAAEIGALVIEDYDVTPISLLDRLALYAGAEMNFGVASGPMFFCALTDYPCMSFDWGLGMQEQRLVLSGIAKGANMPWCGPNQWTFWEPDTLDVLRREFNNWQKAAA